MGQQQPVWRRPTEDDYDWDEGITPADKEAFLRKQPPIREVAPPPQDALEFGYQATKSLNPVEIAKGLWGAVSHPIDTATSLARVPFSRAGEALDEAGQGNYGRAAVKTVAAAAPVAGAVMGGLPGYLAGVGVGAGADETMAQAGQGNYATAAGTAVDTGVQAMLGRGAVNRVPQTPAQLGSALEQRVSAKSAKLFAPVVGHHKANYGNLAEDIGGRILRETTGGSVDDIKRQITTRREAARASLDAAYDRIPSGYRMKTDVVKQALQKEMRGLMVTNNNGRLEVPTGNLAAYLGLNEALESLNGLPATMSAKDVRVLRQSWDKIADFKPNTATASDWKGATEASARADSFKAARTFLNEQTKGVWPQLAAEMDNSHFSIQADDLLQALHESERGRPKVGRNIMSAGIGGMAAMASGKGAIGGVVGAMVAPLLTNVVTERLGPAYQVQSARVMANLAQEIRTNGQTPRAIELAKQLQQLALTANRAGRANQRVQSDEAVQLPQQMVTSPEQAAASGQSPTSWFQTVLQKGGR